MRVIHIKTGNEYKVVNQDCVNATNGENDGQRMVVYSTLPPISPFSYVRDYDEFWAKFKLKDKNAGDRK